MSYYLRHGDRKTVSDPQYPVKVNSNTFGCDQNGETRTGAPRRFEERDLNVLLRNWRRLNVGMEGRNCWEPGTSFCLTYRPRSLSFSVSLSLRLWLIHVVCLRDVFRKYRRIL